MYIDLDDLDEYSEEATVAAFRDYYTFLTKLFLKESAIFEPPLDGWPAITVESMDDLGKDDKVISLLRKLPYIGQPVDDLGYEPHVYSSQGRPANWDLIARHLSRAENPRDEAEGLRLLTEGHLAEHVPPSVFSLTCGGRETDVMLLDTWLGLIYWHQCPDEVCDEPCRPMVAINHHAMVENGEITNEEAEWRGDSSCWTIPDFFEVLKDHFRKLNWIPLDGGEEIVELGFTTYGSEVEGMLQNIFREHGWPNLDEFDKEECNKAVRSAMHQKFPDDDHWKPRPSILFPDPSQP